MADERNNYDEASATVESTDRGLFGFLKKKNEDDHKPYDTEGITSGIEKVQVSEHPNYGTENVHGEHPAYGTEKVHGSEHQSYGTEKVHGHEHPSYGVEKVHVAEPGFGKEKEQHGSLLEKFHRSDNSSSSSSDEERDDEEKKRRRKEKKERKEKKGGLKEKIQEKLGGGHKEDEYHHHGDTNVPIEKVHVEEVKYSEPSYNASDHHHQGEEEKKGGLIDKIKDKLPGHNKDKAEHHEVVAPVVADPCLEEKEKEKKGLLDKIKDKIPGFHSKNDAEEKKDHDDK